MVTYLERRWTRANGLAVQGTAQWISHTWAVGTMSRLAGSGPFIGPPFVCLEAYDTLGLHHYQPSTLSR